jgi:predicted transcriptional regulator
MQRVPLSDYVLANGQSKTAAELGVYQSAISKAIKQSRKVNVLIHDDGKIEAEEIRSFPSTSKKSDEKKDTSISV